MSRAFRILVCAVVCAIALLAQSDTGELRLKVTDQEGLPIPSSVELVSQVNQVRQKLETSVEGTLVVKRLPFGVYRLRVERAGFAPLSELVEIRSSLPKELRVTLGVAPIETVVTVSESETLIDPHRAGTVNRIGSDTLQDRTNGQPGRSLLDLVDTQPGWLLEANGVLHPRGSEYQTQYVVDGIPLTENRSPAFSPELEADDVQSMSVLTAGYPAEYGRKLGGVIEVTTVRDARPGFHGKAVLNGGSFDTAGGDLSAQYGWGRNTLSASGDAARTDRYLDPPVEENYTNAGTNASFAAHYERDLTDSDRFGLIVRRGESRFQIPNELVQQEAGQRQDRGTEETAGQFSYQHIFSPNIVADLRGMVRDISATLWSNPLATPILASQNRGLRETYLKTTVSAHFGRHELRAGVEADFGSLHESFGYRITDPSQFDPATAPVFQFLGRAQDREQALFVQDLMRFGHLTIEAGLRWDHYRLLVDDNGVSPRLGVAWYWPRADLVFRGSFDRVFQTPAFENLLLASSTAVDSLNGNVLRLPVRPSHGNFFEGGLAKGFFGKIRLDANYFRRSMDNFADDDVLLNTGVSFPIAFRKAEIHGVEAKLEIPRWGPVSGFVSYSNMLGVGYLPVTGGLFLGSDAASVLGSSTSFPITQDQRNSVRSRFRYQIAPRFWVAMGGSYNSGLPVAFDGSYADAVEQYGQRIVSRVNLDRGRVRPSFSLDASAGIIAWQKEKRSVRFQADVRNLTDRLNVIDFAGLFSGTAIAAPRSFSLRLQTEF
ncbi:MAG TPA: TonB-dependent receptor [Bryobacteraceae bacterium]|nr:TonB-dependent receptor [Bryobacteraceae bacterium]